MNPAELRAFLDELEKIAISSHRLRMSKTRSGRRPMSVDTMLRKEKEGSFYKEAYTLSDIAAGLGLASAAGAGLGALGAGEGERSEAAVRGGLGTLVGSSLGGLGGAIAGGGHLKYVVPAALGGGVLGHLLSRKQEGSEKEHWGRAAGVGAGVGGLTGLGMAGLSIRDALRDRAASPPMTLGRALEHMRRNASSYDTEASVLEGAKRLVEADLAHHAAIPRRIAGVTAQIGAGGMALGALGALGAYGAYRGAKRLLKGRGEKTAGLIDSAYGGHGYSNESTASPGPQVGKPASGKKKPGDSPSLDEPSSYPKIEQVQTNQSTTAPYRMM